MRDGALISSLQDALSYDPETGAFVWRHDRGNGIRAGSIAGSMTYYGYWAISFKEEKILAHRIAIAFSTGAWPTMDVDHINGNRIDNRLSNLRVVTRSCNLLNQHLARGFHPRPSGKFLAQIQVRGKMRHLGLFDTPEAARAAYLAARAELIGGTAA